MPNSKSQSWSMDIILGVIIFMGAFFLFYSLLNEPGEKATGLQQEASSVIKQVVSEGNELSVVDGNEINESRLNELKNASYDQLKRDLRIGGDFCIYFEDEKGNLILINNSYKGIGASSINLSGTPCSQK